MNYAAHQSWNVRTQKLKKLQDFDCWMNKSLRQINLYHVSSHDMRNMCTLTKISHIFFKIIIQGYRSPEMQCKTDLPRRIWLFMLILEYIKINKGTLFASYGLGSVKLPHVPEHSFTMDSKLQTKLLLWEGCMCHCEPPAGLTARHRCEPTAFFGFPQT